MSFHLILLQQFFKRARLGTNVVFIDLYQKFYSNCGICYYIIMLYIYVQKFDL